MHLAACGDSGQVEITAVADTSGQARDRLKPGVRAYTGVDELLASGDVDGVIIATPTPTHQELSARVLAAGLPVLCEKPCGPTSAGLRDLAATVTGGPALRVAYWRRFVPELQELHRQIISGELGSLLSMETGQWDHLPPGDDYARDCGTIFADMAVHDLDQIQWLAGERITGIHAVERSGQPTSVSGHSALMTLTLTSGLIAAASIGRWFPDGDACWIRVHGTAGFRDVRFLRPPFSAMQMTAAVREQDEAFAALALGQPDELLATAADAAAVLTVAEAAPTSQAGSDQ